MRVALQSLRPSAVSYGTAFIAVFLMFALINGSKASVIPVAGGYEVSYGINMNPGTSNGSDIHGAFIFEWGNNGNFGVNYAYTIAGFGQTNLIHTIDFAPTSSLLIGYGLGTPGIGDEKDHIYTVTSSVFAGTVGGLKWSEAFPGISPETRVGHNALIQLLIGAEAGDVTALGALTDFGANEAYVAAFDTTGRFVVLEWSTCDNGGVWPECIPIGGNVPEPATLALVGLGLAGLGFARRKQ